MEITSINDVLSLIKEYNDKLLSKKETDNTEVSALEKAIQDGKLSEEEIAKLSSLGVKEEIIQRIYVINQLKERGFELQKDQQDLLSIFKEIKDSVLEKSRKTDEIIKNNELLIKKIESNEHLDSYSLSLFKDMFLDSENKMSLSERLRVVEEVIKYNATCENIEEEKTSTNSTSKSTSRTYNKRELSQEEIEEFDKKISEILLEYGYNYDELDDETKRYFRNYGYDKLDNISSVLKTLKENDIRIDSGIDLDEDGSLTDEMKKKLNMVLARVLVNSTSEIIDAIKEDFEIVDKSVLIKFIKRAPQILVPNKRKISKSNRPSRPSESDNDTLEGGYNNYVENKEFFNSLNISFKYILENVISLLCHKPENIKASYDIYTKIYNIPFITEENKQEDGTYIPTSITALTRPADTIALNIDRYIETSLEGYEYVKNNPTKPNAFSEKKDILDLYRIKLAEKEGLSLFFVAGPKKGVQIYKKPSRLSPENLTEILSYDLDTAREKFDPNSKDANGNWQERELDSELNKKCEILITGREDVADDWEYKEEVINDPYIKYLEDNCKIDDYVYAIVDDDNKTKTIISRKKVLRIFGQLLKEEIDKKDKIRFAISYKSLINEDDAINIEVLVEKMVNTLNNNEEITGGKH